VKRLFGLAILGVLLVLGQSTAYAVPILQLYIEGGYYDVGRESWVAQAPGGDTFRLWAIGNVAGPGGAGTISDVNLSVAYDASLAGNITITLTPTLIGGTGAYDRFLDSGVPGLPTLLQEQPDGTILPKLSDGRDLPKHDAYGPGVSWQEFALGNFTSNLDPIADFIQSDDFTGPDPFEIDDIQEISYYPNGGQINAYDVGVSLNGSSTHGLLLHFDLYDNIQSNNKVKAKFAPFSHDAELVPEPGSAAIWILIGLTWAGSAWMFQYFRQWQQFEHEELAFAAAGEHRAVALPSQAAATAGALRGREEPKPTTTQQT
jgi:hypothetical protein